MYFIIKPRQRNLAYFISSFSKIFTLNSIHWISQTFLIQQNIFVFIITYWCNNIFIHTLCFFMLTTLICEGWIHLWLQSCKFLNTNTTCFIFHFTNNSFVWIIIIFWLSWINTKIKHFFILTKIFINIFAFNFIHWIISFRE